MAVLILVLIAALAAAAPASAQVELGGCSWTLRTDPVVVNVLYPDEDAVYYSTRLPAPPPGVSYRIRGQFPHARYTSFTSYNGLPMDALLDADIPPDAGSVNPFVAGADRTAASRSYTVRLIPEPAPADPAARQPGALYVGGGQLGSPAAAFYVLYRIYVPDRGMGSAAGVPLPRIEAVGPADVNLEAASCEQLYGGMDELPLADVHEQYARTPVPVSAPVPVSSTSPPTWTAESGLTAAVLGGAGQADLVSGGPASNPHNRYLTAHVSRSLGEVLAIRGRAPTTPQTFDGQPVMGHGQLRYWSFCQNSRTTRFIDCVSDSHVELDEDGWYTIAVSDPSRRPPSARNWLPFGPEPGGSILYRHMLPSPDFLPRSAQGAGDAPLDQSMGEYFPRAAYCTLAQFEEDACGLEGPAS